MSLFEPYQNLAPVSVLSPEEKSGLQVIQKLAPRLALTILLLAVSPVAKSFAKSIESI